MDNPPTLWRFALRLWRDKNVERVCLRLQDEYGVPVATLLVALWLADGGRRPDAALGRRLSAHAEGFEERYLRPLRAVRRRAADDAGASELKRQIQEAELEGERLLLEQLAGLARTVPGEGSGSALGWLLLVVPEMGQCEGLQALLEQLAALSESRAASG
ncbi:TIGR02444 family protein [Alloalcanivorax sp. C16-1]|uniref:TIGR02444 family protein n=1 Tax=Alloalcanivorax sp. C16-1 TaxID=3390051 RepID=UPI0039706FDE